MAARSARWIPAALLLACAAAGPAAAARPGLTVRGDGTLLLNGKPYRGIGVNFFDAFARTLPDASVTSYDGAFAELERRRIPFARFMCGGFWPVEMRLYRENPEEYFRRLDRVVESAGHHHVGLIPSLFWNLCTVPDIVGEPCDQWGNTSSKTHAFMRDYVRQVVRRYRDSSAIWAWEFGNEYNLAADLPNAAEHRPAVWPNLGTAASRSARDDMTHEAIRTAFAAFAQEVRKLDSWRPITSGNGFPRPSAWHQMFEHSWTQDTPEQNGEMLAKDNPDPMNMLSVHAYEDYKRIPDACQTARATRKPLFVGEFGVPGEDTPENRQRLADMLATIERDGVPLAALWVYEFGSQDDWSVTAANKRAWQLDAVQQSNDRLQRTPRT